jgi:hypothetical protein
VIELAPPRGGSAPAAIPHRQIARVAASSLAAALLFWSPLLVGGALGGRDWATHHWHYFDWVRTALVDYGTLPLYMADAWVTKNFLANAESPWLGPLTPLLVLLPTDAYLKLLLVLFCAAGLAGVFLLLRDLRVGPPVAAFGAVVFAFGGFFAAHVAAGHPWALGGYLLPWLLLLYRRGALGSRAALLGAAILNAATLLGGQHQPFVWQNLLLGVFAALWSLRARSIFPLTSLGLLWLGAIGLGAVKILPMWAEFASYGPEARIQALPPGLLLASLAGPGQHPELAPGALSFAHGAGWWEYAFYLGALPLMALCAGLAAARGCWPLVAAGAFFLLLALEWPLAWLDAWGRLESLPVWRTQRAPSRFLFVALFAFTVAAGPGLERLYAAARRRRPRAARAIAIALGIGVAGDLFVQSLAWQRSATGEPVAARDHRPRPFAFGNRDARAELVGFSPNRLVYRVAAARPAELVFPLRQRPRAAEWRVDDLPARARDGRLSVDLPPGERDLVLTYRPPLFHAGLAASALACAAAVILVARRGRPRR